MDPETGLCAVVCILLSADIMVRMLLSHNNLSCLMLPKQIISRRKCTRKDEDNNRQQAMREVGPTTKARIFQNTGVITSFNTEPSALAPAQSSSTYRSAFTAFNNRLA